MQGGVTLIAAVLRSATAVKTKVNGQIEIFAVVNGQATISQGGGTRVCCVLRCLSAVKILTENFLLLHCIDPMTTDIFAKILL